MLWLAASLWLVLARAPHAVAIAPSPGQYEELCVRVVRAMKAGDHAAAESLVAEAFLLAENFDPHDRRQVNIRVLRGEVARNRGQADVAEDWYRQALATAETAFGPNAPELIFPLEALGNLYSLHGRRDRAIAIDERLLAVAEHANPPDPLSVASRCRVVAEAYVAAGHPAEAEPFYRRAVQAAQTFPPALASDTAEYMRALASYLSSEHRLPEARTIAEDALRLAEKSLGSDDLGLCVHLETCGDIRLAAKEPDAAAALYDRSLRILERFAGTGSADLARPLVRLAAAEQARGNASKSESLCERAATVVTQGLGADAPELGPVLEQRASLLDALKRADEANSLRRRAADLRKHAAG
jgi:tetratricopeptide (TPR) repeat protein